MKVREFPKVETFPKVGGWTLKYLQLEQDSDYFQMDFEQNGYRSRVSVDSKLFFLAKDKSAFIAEIERQLAKDTERWINMKHLIDNEDGAVGALSLLTIVFVVLKLTDKIDWDWWWVVSPTLFEVGIALLALVVVLGVHTKRGR